MLLLHLGLGLVLLQEEFLDVLFKLKLLFLFGKKERISAFLVNQHFFGIFTLFDTEFILVVPHVVLTVLLSSLLHLLLIQGQLTSFFLELLPLLLNLILELSDFIIVTLHRNLEFSRPHLIYVVNLGFQALNCLRDRVKGDLLDKNLIGDLNV